jgi:hypothetical protein
VRGGDLVGAGGVGAEGLFGDHGGAEVGADGGGGAAVEEPDEDVAAVPLSTVWKSARMNANVAALGMAPSRVSVSSST